MENTPQTCAEERIVCGVPISELPCVRPIETNVVCTHETDIDGYHVTLDVIYGDMPERWNRGIAMIVEKAFQRYHAMKAEELNRGFSITK